MKNNITLFLLFFLCAIQLHAQKCKYDLDKKDPMTEERVRRITYSIKDYFKVSMYRKADDFRLELNVHFAGERNFKVVAGEKLDVKLGNGAILTLSAAQDAVPVSYVAMRQVMTTYAVSYYITKQQMEQIASSGFTVARVKMGGEELTYEAGNKITEKSATGAKCMLQN